MLKYGIFFILFFLMIYELIEFRVVLRKVVLELFFYLNKEVKDCIV